MQAIIEGLVDFKEASYTILTFVVLRPGKPPHDSAGSEWFQHLGPPLPLPRFHPEVGWE